LHDEDLIYQREVAALRAQGLAQPGMDWVGVTVTWKAVLLEGLEVVFVILTLGGQSAAAFHVALWGALAAGVLVLLVGLLLHQPLTRVPENWLKLSVGVLLCSFGVFWGAEDFLPFVNPNLSHFFTPSARPAHNESGLHHSTYDDATWPSGYEGVGRQYCVKPGHAAAPSPATPHTRCCSAHHAA
jgi:ferrous iron uptake permease (iron-lead transporter)